MVEHDNDPSRRIGNRAVNKAQTFFEDNEDHDFLFERIDQRNDIGIDAILTLAQFGPDAGLSVSLQIKGGEEYKRKLHVDGRYRRKGQTSYRSSDWRLSPDVTPPRGFEGHHVIDINSRLRDVWRNSRAIYVLVQDPDDGELYYGNLARMADVEPLTQDLADAYVRMGAPKDDSRFHKYLANVHKRISELGGDERKLRLYKTWIPLYPDLRLTPDGLDRFLESARAEARQPIPDRSDATGKVPIYVTYPDGTIGLSREALDAIRHRELKN
jgi:hypothetical protein